MATLDFAPLFRSSIGFDRLPMLLTEAMRREELGYPPYNIEKLGEDSYRIVMAVAGFGPDDIEVITEQNRLTVRGEIGAAEGERAYLHRGIASRSFSRSFDLADFVKVTAATLQDGLLAIALQREIPEEMKPRKIAIQAGSAAKQEPQRLEKAAA